jgi:hypothetical protein
MLKVEGTRRLWQVTFAEWKAGQWKAFAQVNVIAHCELQAMRLGARHVQIEPGGGVAAHAEPLVRVTSSKRVLRTKRRRIQLRKFAQRALRRPSLLQRAA